MLTPLDEAHNAMVQNADSDAQRLRFYERLVSVELFLLLECEPSSDKIKPQVFPVEGGEFVLIFDSEVRLAEFSGQTAAYVAMSGRAIIEMLMAGGAEVGLGINLGVAPSSFLMARDGVVWLSEMLGNSATLMRGQPLAFYAPTGVDADFLAAISAKLAAMTGLAQRAVLVGVEYADGATSTLLAIIAAVEAAEAAIGQSIGEAVSFSASDATLDIGFFAAGDGSVAQIEAVGIGIDIPKAELDKVRVPGAGPGTNPDVPPILR